MHPFPYSSKHPQNGSIDELRGDWEVATSIRLQLRRGGLLFLGEFEPAHFFFVYYGAKLGVAL